MIIRRINEVLLSALLLLSQRVLRTNAQTEGLNPVVQQLNAKVIELGNAVNAISPQILPPLVAGQVIRDPFEFSSTSLGIHILYASGEIPYNGCKNQVFGIDGKYTDLICDLAQDVSSEVCKQEDACDSSVWNAIPVIAMKGDAFQNTELAAKAVCAQFTPYVVNNCPEPGFSQFIPSVQNLQGVIAMLPDGFNNPLLTNGGIIPVQLTNETYVLPTRIMATGDAQIELRKDIYGEELMPIQLKQGAIFDLASYTRDSYEKQSEGDVIVPDERFMLYGVEGYLTQKYKHMYFTTEDELSSLQEFLGPNYTDGKERWCANHLGAYYAWNCASLDEFMAVQDEIVAQIDITSANACGDLVSEEYVSMINRGKKLIEDNTVGTRCSNCSDRKDAWKIGRKTLPWCKWANKKQGTEISERCAAKDLNDECPETCHGCTIPPLTCSDRTDAWKIGRKTLPWCKWANKNKGTEISERCAKKDLYDECPRTCLNCAYD